MVGTGSIARPVFMVGTSSGAATSVSGAMSGLSASVGPSSGMASIHTRTIRTRTTHTMALRTTFRGGSSPSPVAGDVTVVVISRPHVLTALVAFVAEHQRCGDLDGGRDGGKVWLACSCRAQIVHAVVA